MISYKTKLSIIKEVRKTLGIKFRIRFVEMKDGSYADCTGETNLIRFNKKRKETRDEFISTLFHEIGHIIAYKNNKYPVYHKTEIFLNRRQVAAYTKTALRAERYVDLMGERLCKEMYPEVAWSYSYIKYVEIKFLNEYLNSLRGHFGIRKRKIKRENFNV